MIQKLFQNRTYGKFKEGSAVTALVTRTKTRAGNVFWLIKTPFTRKGLYHDPNTFELKEGTVRIIYKYANKNFETHVVPIDPTNDKVIEEV